MYVHSIITIGLPHLQLFTVTWRKAGEPGKYHVRNIITASYIILINMDEINCWSPVNRYAFKVVTVKAP